MKHLNPRQGITIFNDAVGDLDTPFVISVKHLNPRQGITISTASGTRLTIASSNTCETPKSPPGDYNVARDGVAAVARYLTCETPKSPPGDYNHGGPSGGAGQIDPRVKHLNPRQGITM